MDVNSLIKAFSTLDLGSSRTTDLEVTTSTRDEQVKHSLIVRLPTSSSNTAAATPSLNNTALPPQASLLGLPQELKDQIYGYLTEDEESLILGLLFVEVYKLRYPSLSYEECFTSATALHPLSMTCKQMLNDFQTALLRATKTRWTFSINNFDLEQFQFFNDYVNTGLTIKPSDQWLAASAAHRTNPVGYGPRLQHNAQLCLRYQMDSNALTSVARLRHLILSSDPDDRLTMRAFQWADCVPVKIATLYHSRTGVSAKHMQSMTEGEAKRIDFSLNDLMSNEVRQDCWATAGGIRHQRYGWFDMSMVVREFRFGLREAIAETWDIEQTKGGRA
jgi:hypothetical protein